MAYLDQGIYALLWGIFVISSIYYILKVSAFLLKKLINAIFYKANDKFGKN